YSIRISASRFFLKLSCRQTEGRSSLMALRLARPTPKVGERRRSKTRERNTRSTRGTRRRYGFRLLAPLVLLVFLSLISIEAALQNRSRTRSLLQSAAAFLPASVVP